MKSKFIFIAEAHACRSGVELELGALGFIPRKPREKNSSGVSIFVRKVKRVATKNTCKK